MARFNRRSKGSKIYFLPAVANKAAPTAPEISAGTDLTPQVAEVAGFEFTASRIPTPNLADVFTPQIPGEDTAADSTLTFYDLDSSTTIRAALAKGTAGFIVFMPYGNVSTKRCEVWPIVSQGVNDAWTVANESARYAVPFAITDVPNQGAVLP